MSEKKKKPRKFHLSDNFYLAPGCEGQPVIYLKPDEQTHIWIAGRAKLRALKKWIDNAVKYSETK